MLVLWRTDPETMRQQIRETRALTPKPFAVNLNLEFPQEERLAVCLDEGVPIISFFWRDPSSLIARAKAGGALVLHTVGTAEKARQAVDCGVDVIVAQGWEAGGHVCGRVATMPLIRLWLMLFRQRQSWLQAALRTAGAGRCVDAGCSRAWIGTRFLASEEAQIHQRYRERLLEASESDTVYLDNLFDIGWPDAPHRALRNSTIEAWESAGRPTKGTRPGEGETIGLSPLGVPVFRYQSYTPAANTRGDIDAMSLWAGQSVGLVSKVCSAGEIVRKICIDAQTIMQKWGKRGVVARVMLIKQQRERHLDS